MIQVKRKASLLSCVLSPGAQGAQERSTARDSHPTSPLYVYTLRQIYPGIKVLFAQWAFLLR